MVVVSVSEAESSRKQSEVPAGEGAQCQQEDSSSDDSSWEIESDPENRSTSGSLEALVEIEPANLKQVVDDPVEETKGGQKEKADEVQKKWNLRPRNAEGRCRSQAQINAQLQKGKTQEKPSKPRRGRGKKAAAKKEKPKRFSVALTPEEIAHDIFIMTGSKPSSKPAKRDKKLQRILDVRKS